VKKKKPQRHPFGRGRAFLWASYLSTPRTKSEERLVPPSSGKKKEKKDKSRPLPFGVFFFPLLQIRIPSVLDSCFIPFSADLAIIMAIHYEGARSLRWDDITFENEALSPTSGGKNMTLWTFRKKKGEVLMAPAVIFALWCFNTKAKKKPLWRSFALVSLSNNAGKVWTGFPTCF